MKKIQIDQMLLFPPLYSITVVSNFIITNYNKGTVVGFLFTLSIALLFLFTTWTIYFLFFKDIKKSALMVFFSAMLFFSFQNLVILFAWVFMRFSFKQIPKILLGNTGQWISFFVIVLLILYLFNLVRKLEIVKPINIKILNVFSIMLFVFTLFRGIDFVTNQTHFMKAFEAYWQNEVNEKDLFYDGSIDLPDIYYIIFDGFGRSDILFDLYDLDNTSFIEALEKRGFFVATDSYANYTQTETSLASSFNMRYLDEAADFLNKYKANYFPTHYMVENSVVKQNLRNFGYNMVGFTSPISFTDFEDWDFYYRPNLIPDYFSKSFIGTTAITVFINPLMYRWHYDTVNYVIDTIPSAASLEGPKFVFAHIISPHPPFVLDSDGTFNNPKRLFTLNDANHFMLSGSRSEYKEGYKNQVEFLQNSILLMIDEIISNSDSLKIIILQGDHGPGMFYDHENLANSDIPERLGILNAFYFFDQDYSQLYTQISPVNTFRVIFSQYFNKEIPILIDKHYYYAGVWNFIRVDHLLSSE